MDLRRLELLVPDGAPDLAALAPAFPTLALALVRAGDAEGAVRAEAWRAEPFDFWAFDREVDALADAGRPLRVAAPAAAAIAVAREIATRAQRRIGRRNTASAAPWFDRVLAEHRALHDLGKPLVRADLDHALDAWQWTLRLDPGAPAAVQLAVLLHDIERLASEADARIEHRAADYQAFKDAHARAGARIAAAVLARAGAPDEPAALACRLVAVHERVGASPAIRLVSDADALSFFSLNSAGYLAYFGPAQTARKVAYTLARMSAGARRELPLVRIPSEIRRMIRHGHESSSG
jgi:hypothetical protein